MLLANVVQRIQYIWRHPANRGGRLSALLRAVRWQLSKRISGRPWDVEVPGGMLVRCYPDSQSATLLLYCNGLYDFDEMRFLQAYLRPGDHFLDVGANVGIYSLLAASLVGPSGHVDAFEPVPSTLERLEENLRRNDVSQVEIHRVAVGDKPGQVQFDVSQDAMNHMVGEGGDDGRDTIDVPCVTLDQHLSDRSYALAKIDVEGAEPAALRGAQQMLSEADPPVWLLEMNGLLRRFGSNEAEFEEWLEEHGFDLARYDSQRGELVLQRGLWQDRDNVLAVSRSRRREVEERLASNVGCAAAD